MNNSCRESLSSLNLILSVEIYNVFYNGGDGFFFFPGFRRGKKIARWLSSYLSVNDSRNTTANSPEGEVISLEQFVIYLYSDDQGYAYHYPCHRTINAKVYQAVKI